MSSKSGTTEEMFTVVKMLQENLDKDGWDDKHTSFCWIATTFDKNSNVIYHLKEHMSQRCKDAYQICWGSPAVHLVMRTRFWGWGPWFGSSPMERSCCWACPWVLLRCPNWPGTSPGTSPGCHRHPDHTWKKNKYSVKRKLWRLLHIFTIFTINTHLFPYVSQQLI